MRLPRGGGGGGSGASLVSIEVSPDPASVPEGSTEQLTATGTYDDASTLNLTSAVTWTSDDEDIATVSSGSAGGIATGVEPGEAEITATLGAVSGSATLEVTEVTAVASRSTGSQGYADGGPTPQRVTTIPIPVPSDIGANCAVTFSNQSSAYPNSPNEQSITGFNVSVYEGDTASGDPRPTGAALATWTNQTIPGSGDIWTSPTTFDATGKGGDGYLVVVIGNPDADTHFNIASGITTGQYVDGTSTTDPVPGGMSGSNSATGTCRIIGWETSRPRVVVMGDSLANGYGASYAVRREDSAFVSIGPDNDWSVDTLGIAGLTLEQAYNGTLTKYLDGMVVGTALALSNLSINSLPDWADLAAAQASYSDFVDFLTLQGFGQIVLCTLPASSAYLAEETLRQSVNTWLRTVPLGLAAVVDVAAILDDGDELDAAYALADTTHWNTAGHAAVAAEITSVLTPLL